MIISRAPVRISMGGGGTDLKSYYEKFEGFLMAVTINKYVYILVNKRFHKDIRLSYSETEIIDNVENIKHNIFRECLKYLDVKSQIELVSVADVPSNCGLGTSSSFTIALLNGLYAYKRNYITLKELAESACTIEINILKEPIGKQDQYASAFGGLNSYYFHKDGSVTIEPVEIKEENLMDLQNNILLFYLNINRSASKILDVQNKKSIDGDVSTFDRLHKIKEIGLYTKKIFENGNIDEFGEILHQHWLVKKGLNDEISNSLIDEIYENARKNGATGGKIVGAGGGGFLMLYCPQNKSKVINSLYKFGLNPMWFSFDRDGAKKIFSD